MRRKVIYGLLLVALIGAAVETAIRAKWLTGPENWYYDVWHQLAGRRYEPRQVVIVAIDDQTRLEHQDEPLVFWSPYFAKAIETLRRLGAKVIGLDILFSVSAESWLKKLNLTENEVSRTYDLPFRKQMASGQVVLAGDLAINAQGQAKTLLPLPDYWASLPGKLDDVGLVRFYNDPDGVIRRFLLAFPVGQGELWPAFGKLLADRAGAREPAAGAKQLLPYISFTGPPGTIPRISFRSLLSPEIEQDFRTQSLVKERVVIIAYEPTGEQDVHLTPYALGFFNIPSEMMGGAELHANIVETLLSGRSYNSPSAALRVVYPLLVLLAGTVLFFRATPRQGLVGLALLAFLVAAFAYLMFRVSWLVPVAAPQLGLLGCYLGVLGFRLVGEERERQRLRRMFGQYVSDEVVEKMLASGKQPDLGGEALRVTALFSDIRGFTTMSESLSAHEVVEILNNYFSRACEPILEEGGTVDKFIGDAVMAVFGSPAPHPDHARRAIRAALALAQKAREFRTWIAQRFPDRGLHEFRIGIGLHTGEAVVGNIGSPKRFEFTAIGDTVNLASRLEGQSKKLGWTIVASSATIDAAGPGLVLGGQQEVTVAGRQQPIIVMEVKGLEEAEN